MIVDAYELTNRCIEDSGPLSALTWPCRSRSYTSFSFTANNGAGVGVSFDSEQPPSVKNRWGHYDAEDFGKRIGTFNTETGELILDKVTFEGVPGVPEGWRLVRIGLPKEGEWYCTALGSEVVVQQATYDWTLAAVAIVERIPLNIEVGKWYQFSDNSVQKVTTVGARVSTSAGELWEVEHAMREVTVDGAE